MTTELTAQDHGPVATGPTPGEMLQLAIQGGLGVEGIKALAEIYEREQARAAERAFNAAMSDFQHECPVIMKTTKISFPTKSGGSFVAYFAKMDKIIEETRELRHRHGFSHIFEREVTEKQIKVRCTVHHRDGHKASASFSAPIPTDVKISDAHAIAGAVSFCERYAFRAAFGIDTGLDNDGKAFAGGIERMTPEQAADLAALIDDVKPDTAKFCQFFGIEKPEELPAARYKEACAMLRQRAKKGSV